MSHLVWICTTFMLFQASNSYILLTANLEDVQTIARQVAESPVMGQLNRIWRRASNQFNQAYERSGRRNNDEHYKERSTNQNAQRRQPVDDLVDLSKNASVYLSSIKKIFEKI